MEHVRRVVCLVLFLLFLLGAAGMQPILDSTRDTFASQTYIGEGARDPQIVLLTHLLGGFKGLLVDAVWLRAVALQQEERFWELYQLYDWMGKLEPHLEKIWVFNGWNMAYNLVAELDNSESRWQWVARAIEYMRDEGLKYNPKSGQIMQQIAWTFHHKIGKTADYHHFYYKHRWALIMNAVMGDRDMQDMKGVRDAPQNLADLLEDRDVKLVLGREFDLRPDKEPISLLARAEGIYEIPPPVFKVLFATKPENMSYGQFLSTPEGSAARKVINYIVSRVLRERFKMTRLDLVAGIEEQFGKFDWRLPEPHALYWGALASMVDPDPNKQIDYDRMVMFSLRESMQRGKIAYMDPVPGGQFITAWDLSKIRPLHELYLRMLVKHPDDWDHRGGSSVRDGHLQFLQEACFTLYFAGYEETARYYFNEMKRLYNKPAEPDMTMEAYNIGQVKKMIDEFGSYDRVRSFVDALIFNSVFKYTLDDIDGARQYEQLARRAWDAYRQYTKAQTESHQQAPRDLEPGETVEAVPTAPGGRIRHPGNLPSWRELYRENLRLILLGEGGFPPGLLPALYAKLNLKREDVQSGAAVLPGEGIVPYLAPSSPIPR